MHLAYSAQLFLIISFSHLISPFRSGCYSKPYQPIHNFASTRKINFLSLLLLLPSFLFFLCSVNVPFGALLAPPNPRLDPLFLLFQFRFSFFFLIDCSFFLLLLRHFSCVFLARRSYVTSCFSSSDCSPCKVCLTIFSSYHHSLH